MRRSRTSIRHQQSTPFTSFNGGIGLPALMALMGHVTPEMTLRYAKLATPTIRSAYQAAMDKVRAGQLLPLTAVNAAPPVPDKVAWLHAEMLKTRLAHGFCARPKAAGPCPYANICEQCDFFVPDPRPSRRSAPNSTTSAPCKPTPKPAAGMTKPPGTSASRPASRQHLQRLRRDRSTDLLLDPGREGRLIADLVQPTSLDQSRVSNTSRTRRQRLGAVEDDQQPHVEGAPGRPGPPAGRGTRSRSPWSRPTAPAASWCPRWRWPARHDAALGEVHAVDHDTVMSCPDRSCAISSASAVSVWPRTGGKSPSWWPILPPCDLRADRLGGPRVPAGGDPGQHLLHHHLRSKSRRRSGHSWNGTSRPSRVRARGRSTGTRRPPRVTDPLRGRAAPRPGHVVFALRPGHLGHLGLKHRRHHRQSGGHAHRQQALPRSSRRYRPSPAQPPSADPAARQRRSCQRGEQ